VFFPQPHKGALTNPNVAMRFLDYRSMSF